MLVVSQAHSPRLAGSPGSVVRSARETAVAEQLPRSGPVMSQEGGDGARPTGLLNGFPGDPLQRAPPQKPDGPSPGLTPKHQN